MGRPGGGRPPESSARPHGPSPSAGPIPHVPAERRGAPIKRVLIIDDSRFERAPVRHLAEAEGADLLDAEDGENGVALAPEARPDLILLDYRLPGWDGFEAIRRPAGRPPHRLHPRHPDLGESDVLIRAEARPGRPSTSWSSRSTRSS
ncbi:MAG: response regulator [Isosphaeraceae bacterium]